MAATTSRRWLPWLVAVIILGAANVLAFIVVSAAIGGDALNGHVTDGHYFVGSHGTYTEVSRAAWTANLIHGIVTVLSWPCVVLSLMILLFRYVFPFVVGGTAPGQAAARVASLRSSGTLLWRGWPGGLAGSLDASAGLLGAEVYPGGIVVRLRFMPATAIGAGEIRSVRLGRRILRPMIEVRHAGIDTTSPLILNGGPGSPQARALLSLAPDDATPGTGPAPAAPGGRGIAAAASIDAAPRPAAGRMRVMRLAGLVAGPAVIVASLAILDSIGDTFGTIWTFLAVWIIAIIARRVLGGGW